MKDRDPRQLNLFAQRPPSMPGTVLFERELAGARQELHNLQVMQMKPGTPERLELLRKFEVSVRAEIKLRRAAIAHARSMGKPSVG
jgi:hypothetical protein